MGRQEKEEWRKKSGNGGETNVKTRKWKGNDAGSRK